MSAVTEVEQRISRLLKTELGAEQVMLGEPLQALWGGQGQLLRVYCDLPGRESLIVKYIAPSAGAEHPRGWNTNLSTVRKARSYDVECHWYEHYARRCSTHCKVAELLGLKRHEHYKVLLLEDLSVDYPRLCHSLSVEDVSLCLQWLAEFHALFLYDNGEGLWPQGCYWHLETRPDEWQAMHDGPLKQGASWLDAQLRQARFWTLVHGDAKVANFCFKSDMSGASAVDFQYVGRGCGMSDVVYLLGSCLTEQECECYEQALLDNYFSALSKALLRQLISDDQAGGLAKSSTPSVMFEALEQEWRALYAIAWADFQRFLLGWMPTHSKINRYTDRLCQEALSGW